MGAAFLLNQTHESNADSTPSMHRDVFFSVLLHVLVLALMVTFALWKEKKQEKPLLRIEVSIVTNKQLATLQQRANPVLKAEKRSILAASKPLKPTSSLVPQAALKPVAKPGSAARRVVKPKPMLSPAVKVPSAVELETVLKPQALAETVFIPATAPEAIVNLEQRPEPIVNMEPAMKPIVSFEPAAQPLIRMERPSKPVLKLKAKPVAVVDMQAMAEPVIDLEPRPVPIINLNAGPSPLSRPKPATLAKPSLKPTLSPMPKPLAKLKPPPVIKSKPIIDPNYDPFAPLESASDQQQRPKIENIEKPDLDQSELARITEKQLTKKEIDHYIGHMRAAVEKQWKIPVAIPGVKNPLVEMVLQPNGQIKSLIILEGSGNATLNASLIRAIQAAAPFEVPKEQFEYFRVNRIRFHPFK